MLIAGVGLFLLAALIGLPTEWPGLVEYVVGGADVGLIAIGYRLPKGERFDLS